MFPLPRSLFACNTLSLELFQNQDFTTLAILALWPGEFLVV